MSTRFPFLSQQAGLPPDVQSDLRLSDSEFGARHKRGKAARLEHLENMENRLQIRPLQSRLAKVQSLLEKLERHVGGDRNTFVGCLAPPTTLAQAAAVFDLTFLRSNDEGPTITLDAEVMAEQLRVIVNDDISLDIFRSLLVNVRADQSAHDIALRHKLGRQAIYDRQNRMVSKLDELLSTVDYVALKDYLRSEACVMKGTRLISSTMHPLSAILLLEAGSFPSIHDVIATAMWGVARAETGKKQAFKLSDGPKSSSPDLVLNRN